MLGYTVALVIAARRAEWRPVRFVLMAAYAFGSLTLLAGLVSFASGIITGFVLVTTIWGVLVGWIVGQVLVARRGLRSGPRDVAGRGAGGLGPAPPSPARFRLRTP